mgnify:CR=1 FL=1
MPGGYSYIGNIRIDEAAGELVSQCVGASALKDTCADNASLEVSSTTGKIQIMEPGTSLANGVARGKLSKYAGTWIQTGITAAAEGFNLQNTYGSHLIVDRVLVYTTTAVGGATVDIGTTASTGASSDNLIDAGSIASTGAIDNLEDAGTNGKTRQVWASTEFLTCHLSAHTGYVGFCAIHVIDISS